MEFFFFWLGNFFSFFFCVFFVGMEFFFLVGHMLESLLDELMEMKDFWG